MVQREANHSIPVVVLGGFLGSGKTTLLASLLTFYKKNGIKPAVIMNELGDIGLDEIPSELDVPVRELLSGCICCTMKADLAGELMMLTSQRPDVILVEATGAANPLELIENVMEASMLSPVHLGAAITVVDGSGLLQLRKGSRRTYRLLEDGIRCATHLVLNKRDRLYPEEMVELQQLLRELNPHASLISTERSSVEDVWISSLTSGSGKAVTPEEVSAQNRMVPNQACDCGLDHSHDDDAHDHEHSHRHHEHLMAVSYYPDQPFDSDSFERMLRSLPDPIYRVKGLVTFSDTSSRYQVQYAFKETDFMPVMAAPEVPDVLIFIGEHFSREELLRSLAGLGGNLK
ncbi:GTPase, G3E family [Paenibacillaceae bacterium GAS479]|nr:GTPase, G3E family [Paenibacillaceae bacterium GAS479]